MFLHCFLVKWSILDIPPINVTNINKVNTIISNPNRNKANQNNKETTTQSDNQHLLTMLNHEREDLEAAEVLTSLAGNYRHRMMYGSGHAVMLDQP